MFKVEYLVMEKQNEVTYTLILDSPNLTLTQHLESRPTKMSDEEFVSFKDKINSVIHATHAIISDSVDKFSFDEIENTLTESIEEEPFVEMEINKFIYILYNNRLCFITDIEYHGDNSNSRMYVFYDCETKHTYKQTISRITPLDLKVYTKPDRYVELKTTHHYGIIMQTDEKEENYVVDIGNFPVYISSDQVEKLSIRDNADSVILLEDFVQIDFNLKLKYSQRYGIVKCNNYIHYYNDIGYIHYHVDFGNSSHHYESSYMKKINVKGESK